MTGTTASSAVYERTTICFALFDFGRAATSPAGDAHSPESDPSQEGLKDDLGATEDFKDMSRLVEVSESDDEADDIDYEQLDAICMNLVEGFANRKGHPVLPLYTYGDGGRMFVQRTGAWDEWDA